MGHPVLGKRSPPVLVPVWQGEAEAVLPYNTVILAFERREDSRQFEKLMIQGRMRALTHPAPRRGQ